MARAAKVRPADDRKIPEGRRRIGTEMTGAGVRACPRCRSSNRGGARYCARCGLNLSEAVASDAAGRVRHPRPIAPPAGAQPANAAADLHFTWEAAWGGRPILGTEGLAIALHNGGYPLRDVILRLIGRDAKGAEIVRIDQTVEELPRGIATRIEIPSYELPDRSVAAIAVTLVSAEFGPES